MVSFSVLSLFSSGEQGAWYDPTDFLPNWRLNLLTRSEEFDNAAWSKSNLTASSTTLTDAISGSAILMRLYVIGVSVFGSSNALSCEVKAGTRSGFFVGLEDGGIGTHRIKVDLATGSILYTGASLTSASVVPLGDGWYRIVVVGSPSIDNSTGKSCVFGFCDKTVTSTVTTIGDGTGTILIRNADLRLTSNASVSPTYQKITDGIQDYLTYQPQPVMFQDSAGTTPVTAVEQPVGLIRDKSGRGNHASQSTAASRPVLSARVNLLTYSEQFDNAAWTKTNTTITQNSTAAPDGATTADTVFETVTNAGHAVAQSVTTIAGSYTYSASIKPIGRQWVRLMVYDGTTFRWVSFDVSSGTVGTTSGATGTIAAQSNGFYRCTVAVTTAAGSGFVYAHSMTTDGGSDVFAGDITKGFYIWGADLRVTNDGVGLPAYQRVVDATTYDTNGFPLYLAFDGVDDGLATGSIDFSATDKMSVFAGVRKLADASFPMLVELSALSSSNSGAFGFNGNAAGYTFQSRGTVNAQANTATGNAAPITNVLSGFADISGDAVSWRSNGIVAASSPTDQGTGNYGNYPLYIGRRGGTTLPFNGRLYSLIVRGAQSTDSQIASTENYVNNLTEAY
jgi:hypothetical protein